MADMVEGIPERSEKLARDFLKVLKAKAGNVSVACEACGIDRQTYYNWLERSEEFKKECEHIRESVIDFAESRLLRNIDEGKEASTIFFLKTIGRRRGYIERQVVEHEGAVPVVDIELEKRKARQLLAEQDGGE